MTEWTPERVAMGSELYARMIELNADERERIQALMRKAWDATPWMLDAWTGDQERLRAIREWCAERFGPEGWPLHDRPTRWFLGGATIGGWTWMGFDTEEAMREFEAAWPAPTPGGRDEG